MEIIPTISIFEGQTVGFYKGNSEQKEVFKKTPLDYAKLFVRQGAKTIYIVDLDAANDEVIKEIRSQIDVELICAGKIRTMEKVKQLFDLGINRIVLGVAAEPIYKEAILTYGDEKIIVGIKAKGDKVLTSVKRPFPLRVIDFAEKLHEYGVKYVLFKDMFKESTQVGPNYDEVDRMLQMTSLKVYASGGIGKKKHLETLKNIGTEGAVIGKAFYEHELDLEELLTLY